MQVKKTEIAKLFSELRLEVRTTLHRFGWLVVDGKKILRVHYSHGKGDLPGRVADKVRGQARLSRNEFKELIECPLSLEDYLMVLRSKGLIE